MNSPTRYALTLAALSATAASAGWTADGGCSTSFSALGPAGFKIEGSTTKVEVREDGGTLTFAINLNDVDTGMALRNRHMLEDLESSKFPLAELSVPLDALTVPEDGKAVEGEAKGTWTMHGQAKAITVKYKASCKAGACDVEGEGPINTKDHGIKIRSYMGITVKPEIVIKAKLQLKR